MKEKTLLRILLICYIVLFLFNFVTIIEGVITNTPEWKVIIQGIAMYFWFKVSVACMNRLEEIKVIESDYSITWDKEEEDK